VSDASQASDSSAREAGRGGGGEERSCWTCCSIALFAAAASEILFSPFVFAAHFLFILFFGVLFRCGKRAVVCLAHLGKNWGRFGPRTIAKVLFRNGGAFVAAATGVSSDAFAAPLAAPLPAAARSAVPATSAAR